ncbi:MAG: hypothetical protein D6712_08895 [Chloroflexi bacterium]|nr:MAG: hypothetical protein D6712_08895 [Chloroflexota bacterium]
MSDTQNTSANRKCPRCGTLFACHIAAGHESCWCFDLPKTVPLTGANFPDEPRYEGCLCPNCLRQWLTIQQKNIASED